jgi:hypothetical protein
LVRLKFLRKICSMSTWRFINSAIDYWPRRR